MAQIDNDLHASKVEKAVDILRAIKWVAVTWNEVTIDTIENWFAKYGITEKIAEDNDGELDEEFAESNR